MQTKRESMKLTRAEAFRELVVLISSWHERQLLPSDAMTMLALGCVCFTEIPSGRIPAKIQKALHIILNDFMVIVDEWGIHGLVALIDRSESKQSLLAMLQDARLELIRSKAAAAKSSAANAEESTN